MSNWLFILVFALLKPVGTLAGEGLALIAWLEANGGFFSPKVEFRHLDPNDDTSPNGLFANEAMAKDETIMIIPFKCLLKSPDQTECGAARALARHVRQGENSFFKDYVDYLFDGTRHRSLPDRWSNEGKEILEKILGDELPSPFFDRSYKTHCSRTSDDLLEDCYEFVIARSWTENMVPLLDMINHRNGRWLNVESTSAHTGEDIRVYTLHDVAAGEQLHNTYNECLDWDCEGIFLTYGTQDIVRDYGFVEQYPQRWIWDEDTFPGRHGTETLSLVYELDLVTAPDLYSGEPKEQFQVTWHTDARPDLQVIGSMTSHLNHLAGLEDYVMSSTQALESGHERYTIREYYKAIQLALKYAIWSTYDEAIDLGFVDPRTAETKETRRRYDNLEPRDAAFDATHDMQPRTCHYRHDQIGPDYPLFYQTKSQYQLIEFSHSIENDDTCLWLDNLGHACSAFRVYHEALIHYPASFLPELKRVAYIGGGDNMILHELLKYPSIELVVGMELDQQVVRTSFMHLGTLPYFDDPRVEWWFGNAAKSLLALPSEYFGSFDLVLVDLKNEVADFLHVSRDLSLLDSAKLLLKKSHGIIVKQEDFANRLVTDFARYTAELEYKDLPQICRQSITIGSNGINFLTAPQYNHSIEMLYLNDTVEYTTRFKNFYTFRDNDRVRATANTPSTAGTCTSGDMDSTFVVPTKNLGIFVVIEAEELVGGLKSNDELVGALTKALDSHGFVVESVNYSSKQQDIVLLFPEGYLTLRTRPVLKSDYVAVDMQLWDNLDKMNILKASILSSIGGNERASSYRFATGVGGMQGTSKSPYISSYAQEARAAVCESSIPLTNDPSVAAKDEIAWIELARMIPGNVPSILVLCGSQNEPCTTMETLKPESFATIPIYACDNVSPSADDDQLFQCEVEVMKVIRKSMSRKINGVILDPSTTRTMARVVLRLLTGISGRAEVLDDDYAILSPLLYDDNDEWRQGFVERFLKEISPFAPSKEARLTFHPSDDKRLGALLFSSGDADFYHGLLKAIQFLKDSKAMTITIDSVMSGYASYVRDFEPTTYNNADFRNTRAYQQYNSQHAMGYQTLVQMEFSGPKPQFQVGDDVLYNFDPASFMGGWTDATIAQVHSDGTYDIKGSWGQYQTHIPRDKLRRVVADQKQIDVGARVLMKQLDPHLWTQGMVLSRSENGMYMIWFQDLTLHEKDLTSLVPDYEEPTSTDASSISELVSVERLDAGLGTALRDAIVDVDKTLLCQSRVIGQGCVWTCFWQGGNAVLVWDGATHVDLNLYLDETDDDDEEERTTPRVVAQNVVSQLQEQFPLLVATSVEEQPRGFGHVVNFARDVTENPHVIWWPLESGEHLQRAWFEDPVPDVDDDEEEVNQHDDDEEDDE